MSNAVTTATHARTDGGAPVPADGELPWFSPGCGGCAIAAFFLLLAMIAVVSVTVLLVQRFQF
jgi:hypothetical protein